MNYKHPALSAHPSILLSEGEHKGFQWAVLHNSMGFRCGYIAVPPGHPWHGKEYDNVPAQAHGGLTYSGTNEEDGSHWVGFDCAHYGDSPDPDLPTEHDLGSRFQGIVRSQAYVEENCHSLCEQATEATQA